MNKFKLPEGIAMAEKQITSACVSQKKVNNFLFETLTAQKYERLLQDNLTTSLMHKRNVKKANKTVQVPTVVGYACKMQSQIKMADTRSFPDLLLQMKICWLVVVCA